MSFRYIFTNNSESSLASSITAAQTAITLKAGDGVKFANLSTAQGQLITIFEVGVGVEIVDVYSRVGDILNCNRGFEGTTALAFSTAAKVYSSLTAGQIQALYDKQTVENLDNGGNVKGMDAINIQPGRLNSIDIAGGIKSIALGYSSKTTADNSISIGTEARSSLRSSTTIGRSTNNSAQNSFLWGNFSELKTGYSVSFGNSTRDRMLSGAQNFNSHETMGELTSFPEYNWDLEYQYYCGFNMSFLTESFDLAGGKPWVSGMVLQHGTYVKPTVDNGNMYYWEDNNYPYDDSIIYTPLTLDAIEPTWSLIKYDSVATTNGYIDTVPRADFSRSFPMKFKIDEIDIICYQQTAVTTNAVINIGTAANPTLFASNVTVVLTGAYDVFSVPINKFAVDDLKIGIVTTATATEQLVRFEIKGKYIKHWL